MTCLHAEMNISQQNTGCITSCLHKEMTIEKDTRLILFKECHLLLPSRTAFIGSSVGSNASRNSPNLRDEQNLLSLTRLLISPHKGKGRLQSNRVEYMIIAHSHPQNQTILHKKGTKILIDNIDTSHPYTHTHTQTVGM